MKRERAAVITNTVILHSNAVPNKKYADCEVIRSGGKLCGYFWKGLYIDHRDVSHELEEVRK